MMVDNVTPPSLHLLTKAIHAVFLQNTTNVQDETGNIRTLIMDYYVAIVIAVCDMNMKGRNMKMIIDFIVFDKYDNSMSKFGDESDK